MLPGSRIVRSDEPVGAMMREPTSWRGYEPRGLAWRIFFTCWIVFTLHFAPDIVREHYPAIALGDRLSFRLDEYGGLHPDLFEKEGYGWHIGNNPGISMLAAIPYALSRPVIDPIVRRVRESRLATGATEPPDYASEWPNQREFFRQAWQRGLDVKLVLAAFVTHAFFMAPICALGVVLMFFVLRRLVGGDRLAVALALLYAFGTPLFYRAAFLNHNMVLGIIAFAAFVVLWDPGGTGRFSLKTQFVLAGVAGGAAVLFDYSGVVLLAALFGYALLRHRETTSGPGVLARRTLWYGLGAIGPMVLLWFYQWKSFGHPFLPGQHWMAPVEWIELGYQGYGPPQPELLAALAFDHRFGLFVFSPLLLLALWAPFVRNGTKVSLLRRELWALLGTFAALWLFFSGSNYTRLQFNTGIRYMAPIIPFLFVPAAAVLVRIPRAIARVVAVLSVALAWCLTMYREVERPLGVLDPVIRTLVDGFQLPVLSTLDRTGGAYGGWGADGTSPLALFALAAVLIACVWMKRSGEE
jgi:hypothetical protein